ncbi:transporter substrate-binding domain-containing protein [Caenispirillum bisanense]|uniref:General L-amino acid transport system substrate-binding protein n=1 Tax=Caenispirillum bisanense TaxID=414052 RepID=A0A286GVJ7_9PROT|nr:transporter substrate-binding domain-containing protein [Caenispirillum bisanense]SOD99044.1 general L-amino acid transport system substrate-binding protein [Caenispirillum bisanense]
MTDRWKHLCRGAGSLLGAAAVVAGLAVPPATAADTVAAVRERGVLACGIGEIRGLAERRDDGRFVGFRADVCRAVAAAVLGEPDAVEFVPLVAGARFEALARNEIDVLVAGATWTLARDAGLPIQFTGVHFYDGQGFVAHRRSGWTSLDDVTEARVCVVSDTTSLDNLRTFARTTGRRLEPVERVTREGAWEAFVTNGCDLMTQDMTALVAGLRARAVDLADYTVLPDRISREPLSPAVRDGDKRWAALVRFVVNALVLAEAVGVTQAVAADPAAAAPDDPEARRLLGLEPGLGADLGLDDQWARRALAAVGHYGEVFERHLGAGSPLGLPRGDNALWRDGGLLYPLPMR